MVEPPSVHNITKRGALEISENWREIAGKVPGINFLPEWSVQVVPPFGGAAARFYVNWAGGRVSVYLDWYDVLGAVGTPYWEIYPDHGGDTARFLLGSEQGMVEAIAASLAKQATQIRGET